MASELDEERQFLVASLRDLDAELAAGDIDEHDHQTLTDDYTARLARNLRTSADATDVSPRSSIEPTQAVVASNGRSETPRRSGWGRRVAVGLAIVTFAAVAGVLMAQASGSRGSGDVATGEIRSTVRQRLADCLAVAGRSIQGEDGALLESLQCYDAVLEDEPNNAEALTYKAWVLVLTGEEQFTELGSRYLDDAVAADPAYPDARAFRAVVRSREGRFDEAKADLDTLDTLDPPPVITDLITNFAIRERVEAGLPDS